MPREAFSKHGGLRRLENAGRLWGARARQSLWPARLRPGRPGPPNLLVMAIDTLRYDRLGFAGYVRPLTPALSALAARGVSFTDVTAAAPWTLPSFASSLTGVMPVLHGAGLEGDVRDLDRDPPRAFGGSPATLAAHLERHGYRTAAFYANPFVGFGLAGTFAERRHHNLPAPALTFLAAEWIRRHADTPFFCFVLMNDPHEPTAPPSASLAPRLEDPLYRQRGGETGVPPPARVRELSRWGDLGRLAPPLDARARATLALKLALYDASVAAADAAVGAMLARLGAWGIDRDTLVTVYSDHGEEFLDHLAASRRWRHDPRDLHGIGHGQTQFQELLHVPWLAAGPGVPSGTRVTAPVSLCDIAPTLCEWLGVAPLSLPATAPVLVGRSLAPLAADRATPEAERVVLAEEIAYGPDLVAARRGSWKLIATREGQPFALFDLAADPGEQHDLRDTHPELVRELVAATAPLRKIPVAGGQAGASGQGGWDSVEERVRRQLRELGYTD